MSDSSKAEIPLTEEELRQVTLYAATCARRVLPLFTASYPQDQRPHEAIVEAEAFASGKRRTAALRAAAWAALACARELGDNPAAHAAYAASHAAGAAYLHPIASPHQVKHILGAAVHQALASPPEDSEPLSSAASLASSTVREVLRRYPPPNPGRGRFSELLSKLDTELRK